MPTGVRIALGLLAGIFAGGLSIAVVEQIGHAVAEGEAVFIVAAIGLGLAGFVGGVVSTLVTRRRHLVWLIAIVLAGLSLVNVFSFAHPAWFVPVASVLLGLGAFGASKVAPAAPHSQQVAR
ncbi:MAG: hypothetical protein AAF290_13785 [Pseudomonadota bacterium]